MKHYFIVNPAAGKGKHSEELIKEIEACCREKEVDFEIHLTESVGEATDFVRKKCEENPEGVRFYSCGGDGTNNEVISGVIGFDHVEVGFVPDGTGNDFIKCFNNPENFIDIAAQLDGTPQSIDIFSCNERYVMNIMNIGFDCCVVRRTSKIKRIPLVSKSMAYILGVVIELIRKPGTNVKVSIDGGEPMDRSLLLATFSNGRYYGGGFKAAPKARLCDGLMDVGFVKNISRTKFIGLVKHYRSGNYLDDERFADVVDFYRCRKAKLEFAADQTVCIDGELIEGNSFEIEVLPGALKILVPKGSSFTHDETDAPLPAFMMK